MLRKLFSNAFFAPIDSKNSELVHDEYFSDLIKTQYSRLLKGKHIYLDYTGGNMYSQSQIQSHFELLGTHVFGNPHSTNPTSQFSTTLVEQARARVLEYFAADDYYCIFTQNASASLKIVGECYPFGPDSELLMLCDNHNSVNGIREYSKTKGGNFEYVPLQFEDLCIQPELLESHLVAQSKKLHKLFAYPAQSNVSGVKHGLDWINKAQDNGWDVLLDAAAFVPSNELNLSQVKPNFVSISFYKIFGYPTGIGCLLVRKDSFDKLQKPWFAGGTVALAGVKSPSHFLAQNHERFENGTVNYLDIPAITIGLDYIDSIGMARINERVSSLRQYLYTHLVDLKHDTGVPQVNIFGPQEGDRVGGTMIMTFWNPDNSQISFELIEQLANKRNISVRSGCFCNPGIDEINNCLTTEELSLYFNSRDNGNYSDMVESLQKMRGAIRVSVGLATSKADLDEFVEFVVTSKNTSL